MFAISKPSAYPLERETERGKLIFMFPLERTSHIDGHKLNPLLSLCIYEFISIPNLHIIAIITLYQESFIMF